MAEPEEVETLIRYMLVTLVGEYKDPYVETLDSENAVLSRVVGIMGGQRSFMDDPVEIGSINKIDLDRATVRRLQPVLEGMKIVLKEE